MLQFENHLIGKDKEASFSALFETDNISSVELLLRQNNILNRYLPALHYLASTTPYMRVSARELLVPSFTPLAQIWIQDLLRWKQMLYQQSYRGSALDLANRCGLKNGPCILILFSNLVFLLCSGAQLQGPKVLKHGIHQAMSYLFIH